MQKYHVATPHGLAPLTLVSDSPVAPFIPRAAWLFRSPFTERCEGWHAELKPTCSLSQ